MHISFVWKLKNNVDGMMNKKLILYQNLFPQCLILFQDFLGLI